MRKEKTNQLEVHSVRLAAFFSTSSCRGALVLRSLRLINHLPRYCFTLLRCSCMRHAFQFGVDQGSNAMKWKMPEALYLRTSSQVVFKNDIPAIQHNGISFTGSGGGGKKSGWNRANLGSFRPRIKTPWNPKPWGLMKNFQHPKLFHLLLEKNWLETSSASCIYVQAKCLKVCILRSQKSKLLTAVRVKSGFLFKIVIQVDYHFTVPTSVNDDLANLHILPHLLPQKTMSMIQKMPSNIHLFSFFSSWNLKELTPLVKKHRSHATESWRCIELGDGGHQIQIWWIKLLSHRGFCKDWFGGMHGMVYCVVWVGGTLPKTNVGRWK